MDEQNPTQPYPTGTKQAPKEFRKFEEKPDASKEIPQAGKKSFKWPLVVFMLIFVVLAGVIGYFLLNRTEPPREVAEQPSEDQTVIPDIDTSQIEASLATWVQGMSTQGSMFSSQEVCTSQTNCVAEDPEQNIVALWGMYQYGITSSNTQVSRDAVASIAAVTSPTDAWSCHFLYDIATTGEPTEDQVASMQQACLSQASTSTSEISQQEIMTKLQEIMGGNQSGDEATIFQESAPDRLEELSSQASANAINIIWNEAGQQAALASFDEALSYYTSQQEEIASKAPLLALAALDMYRATEVQQYLEFAEYLYNVHISPTCVTLSGCADFLYLTHELGKVTEGQQYVQYTDLLTRSILDTSFDNTEHANKFGKNALYTIEEERTIYPTRENALVLGTFAKN